LNTKNKDKIFNENESLNVTLRKVDRKDWDFILRLRNMKEYRKNFYEQGIITKKAHYKYLRSQISNNAFLNRIICNDNKDVGYIRILNNDVSIMIDKKHSGKGIGAKALQLIEREAKKSGIKKLVGRIMIHNQSSKKIFVKNNYKLLMYWFEKQLE
jgi:RimJ/RimL family protein N-acetyltransferase